MQSLSGKTVVVAGGTGNVGSFIVRALVERGATVVVPSRSEPKLRGLRAHLRGQVGEAVLKRLKPFVGDVGEEAGAGALAGRIAEEVGEPDAVVATLGRFVAAPSLLGAPAEALRQALDAYTIAHFVVARTFLPGLAARGGAYVFVNGPLAFEPWEGSGAGLVSVATAAQQMLFRALVQELKDSPARVVELVSHAFIRERRTQPGSPIPGEAVGAYAAYLVSDAARDVRGRSIQLRSLDRLRQAGIEGVGVS